MARSRQWGWHQLDRHWAEQIVDQAGIKPGDLVLDVGAGHGALTAPLLARGARVIAFELHSGRADRLRRHFDEEITNGSFKVVQTDATDLRLPRRPFKVVANPPFNVTSALLYRLLQPGSRLVSASLVVQHQAARKWAGPAAPKNNRWGRHFHVSTPHGIPRRAFRPPPRVDSRLLRIDRRH